MPSKLNNIHDVVVIDTKQVPPTAKGIFAKPVEDGFDHAATFVFFTKRPLTEYESHTLAAMIAPVLDDCISVGTQVMQAEEFGPPPHMDADEATAWSIAESELDKLIHTFGGQPPMSEREAYYDRVASLLELADIQPTDDLIERLAVRVSLKLKRLP